MGRRGLGTGRSPHARFIRLRPILTEDLQDSERLFAFVDDDSVSCKPDRTQAIPQSLDREMWDHGIRLHQGKTQLWNRGGVSPELMAAARRSDPSAVVWKGDPGCHFLGTKGFFLRCNVPQRWCLYWDIENFFGDIFFVGCRYFLGI